MAAEKAWDRVITVVITVVVAGILGVIGSSLAGGALIEALGGATKDDVEAAVAAIPQPEAGDEIPSGAVMAFNSPDGCPADWQPLPNAAGRYIVGLPLDGILGKTVGTALGDGENRTVGLHAHAIKSGGAHRHSLAETQGLGKTHGAASGKKVDSHSTSNTGSHSHGIASAGTVAGTNAPFIQLLICEKA